jgi:hypothetical protein
VQVGGVTTDEYECSCAVVSGAVVVSGAAVVLIREVVSAGLPISQDASEKTSVRKRAAESVQIKNFFIFSPFNYAFLRKFSIAEKQALLALVIIPYKISPYKPVQKKITLIA